MVLEKLGQSLRNTLQKITNAMFVDDNLINELIKDIQRSLLQSDVNVKLVFEISNKIKERIKNEPTPKGLGKKDHLVSILYEEITSLMGDGKKKIEITKTPFKLMLVGLFGNGKTTTAGKLAKYYFKRGFKIGMISLDTFRPAAYEQLKQVGAQIGVTVYGDPTQKDPVAVFKKYEGEFHKYDLVIVDTAGRDALDDELVDEIKAIKAAVNPDESLLVMNADIGQAAQKVAQGFADHCGVGGVVISKLDGTAKGGGAISACKVTGAPVLFIGTGEKIDDFEEFKPKNFVGELLGMGDLEKLLSKAQEAMSADQAQDLSKRLIKGEFTLIDLYEQMEAMNKMGPLSKMLELIPGFSSVQLPKEALQVQQDKMVKWKYIMNSCTKTELSDPSEMDSSRIDRIARGSGQSEREVRDLLKHYKQSKKMVKMFKGVGGGLDSDKEMSEKDMKKMMGKMRNMKGMMKGMGGMMR